MNHMRPNGNALQWGYVGVAGNLAQVQEARGQVAAMDLTAVVAHIECTEAAEALASILAEASEWLTTLRGGNR